MSTTTFKISGPGDDYTDDRISIGNPIHLNELLDAPVAFHGYRGTIPLCDLLDFINRWEASASLGHADGTYANEFRSQLYEMVQAVNEQAADFAERART